MDTKRQKQIGKLLQRAMSDVFLQDASHISAGALITVSEATVTPDLAVARFYLSIYNAPNSDELMEKIQENKSHFRLWLGNKVKKQVRKIPQIEFFKDDTLDKVFQLEALFADLNKSQEKE
jgi:ribosome-binding factor A